MKKFFFDCGTRDATASLGHSRAAGDDRADDAHRSRDSENPRAIATLKDKFLCAGFLSAQLPVSAGEPDGLHRRGGRAPSFLIILGLATRPAAFRAGLQHGGGGFRRAWRGAVVHRAARVPVAKEPALLYLIPLIVIILSGAGAFSLDAGIYKESKRRRW